MVNVTGVSGTSGSEESKQTEAVKNQTGPSTEEAFGLKGFNAAPEEMQKFLQLMAEDVCRKAKHDGDRVVKAMKENRFR